MTVEMLEYDYETDSQILIGTITVDDDGNIAHTSTSDLHEKMMQDFATAAVRKQGETFTPDDDPAEWLAAFPYFYNGSMLRARIVE